MEGPALAGRYPKFHPLFGLSFAQGFGGQVQPAVSPSTVLRAGFVERTRSKLTNDRKLEAYATFRPRPPGRGRG